MSHIKRSGERGSLLVMLPVSVLLAVGLLAGSLLLSTTNMKDSRRETKRIQAFYLAKAGVERQIYDIKQMTSMAVLLDAFSSVDSLHQTKTYDDEPLLVGTEVGGTYEVSVKIEGLPLDGSQGPVMSNSQRFVTIRSTGWIPDKNTPGAISRTLETTVLVELSASDVFDYAYFINNWGWFYGSDIAANGSVRSNGQFDAGSNQGHTPTVNGTPRYLGANGSDLYGYRDDNNDNLQDGNDGGIYAGWNIVGADNVQGMASYQSGGEYANQHEFDAYVDMPNLTDLALYEEQAIQNGSTISVGGVQVCDAVYGDDPGESGYICLFGTPENPIEINGTVVVRGSIIIKGTVSGQGVLYSGGNVYVADDIVYSNPPTSPHPAGPTEADFEQWLQQNQNADALGLFAREHVVLGDHTHPWYSFYVGQWMNDPNNQSEEDAGEDGIPNTLAGPDGILGTADDDLLEGDGVWTVDTYTEEHAALGLIPAGSDVGDTIPGSGEDIDGDGVYDGPFSLSELDLPIALDSGQWGGNLPPGAHCMEDVASLYINRFDAALYTNHVLAGIVLAFGDTIDFNGCLISRNESVIYGADQLNINHDPRLIGGGDNFGYYLPRSFKNVRVMRVSDNVPNIHWDEMTVDP